MPFFMNILSEEEAELLCKGIEGKMSNPKYEDHLRLGIPGFLTEFGAVYDKEFDLFTIDITKDFADEHF